MKEQKWRQFAGCKGMDGELFISIGKTKVQQLTAKNICVGSCPVRAACLDFYSHYPQINEDVIAGGYNRRERVKIFREALHARHK